MSHLASSSKRRILLPLTAGALGATLLGVASPTQASPAVSWTQLTHLINNGLASVAIARGPSGTLHVLWVSPANHPTAIKDTVISLAGTVGGTSTVVSGWSQVTVPVAAVGPGGKIEAFWTGPRSSGATDPTVGVDGAALNAGVWKPSGQAILPEHASGVDAVPTGAATLPNGQHVLVWTTAGQLHYAVGGSAPFTAQQVHLVPTPAPGSNGNPVVTVDAKTGAAVAMWTDNGQSYLRQLYPAYGSLQKPSGAGASDQDPELAARSTGGVFTAYTPDHAHVWLVRYQGNRWSVPVPAGADVRVAGLASAPGGRIWVFYGGPATVYATRSNKELTKFEPVQALNGPRQTVDLYHLLGEGSTGPLDLFADFQYADSRNGTYHTRVLAELSVATSTHRLYKTVPVSTKTKTGTTIVNKTVEVGLRVTVTVTDAGDPVAGASIAGLPGGGTHVTKPTGSAGVTYPPGTKGTFSLSVSAAGYRPATAALLIP